jgi:son of sevenless-like protein
MSYYYVHAQTGHVRWTPPSPTSGPRTLLREDPNGRGARTDPYNNSGARTNSETGRQLAQNMRRASVYSDHSEVNPYDDLRPNPGNIRPLPRPGPPAETEEVFVHPLQIARSLQHELSPPALPAISSYSEAACDAINAVVESFAERSRLASLQVDPSEVVAQSAAMAHKVTLVVVAVRNLLYVSGTLTGPLPALANSHMGEDTDWVRSQIKPFQRKVTATLSKLVLSARAVNANPDWPATTSTGRVESDAAELERAVTTFVFEIQRSAASQRAKRLQGVLLPGEDGAGVGPGLIGAGNAGQWKGSGFVLLSGDRAYPPQRKLGREVVSELSNLRLQAEDKIAALFTSITQYKNASLRTPDYGVADVRAVSDRVILAGRLAIAQLSEFLALAEDIDVAGYVDVEGYENVPEAYLQDVQKARVLIRTFETARQALYDDSSVVLMASQAIHVSLFGQGGQGPPEIVHSAIPALRENLGTLMETLELLLDIAQSQGEVHAARQGLHHSSQLGHGDLENNWAEVREPLQGDSGEIVELAEVIQAGGQPASREAWAAQQSQAQQGYSPLPPASSAGEATSTVNGEVPPSASTTTAVESAAPTPGPPDSASIADEEELSDDEFDRKGRPKMGGNRRKSFFPFFIFLSYRFCPFSPVVAI